MGERSGWGVSLVLLLSCLWQISVLAGGDSGFATLPILVPVSLEHERAARAGQPPAVSGEEAIRLAGELLARELTPAQRAALLPEVEAMERTRARMLELRGRRHELNIALMDVGVAVASALTPEQWAQIHMRRDALRARAEADTFGRVLDRLQRP